MSRRIQLMKKGSIILSISIAVIIVVLFALIVYLARTQNKKQLSQIAQRSQTIQPTVHVPKPGQELMPLRRVGKDNLVVTSNGFSPQVVTIIKGSSVIWTNYSGSDVTVNSDNYPTNTLYPPLNLGMFPNKFSVSLVFSKVGTFTYHDQLHPQWTGTVIVNNQ